MTGGPPLEGGGADDAPHERAAAVLLGSWRLLRAAPALDFAPGAGMDFRPGGELLYSFDVGGRRQAIPLRYRVAGDMLLTDNPAAPHATATRFRVGDGGALVLDFAGDEACFVRVEEA